MIYAYINIEKELQLRQSLQLKGNIGKELKKLKVPIRNKVRAIISSTDKVSIEIFNNLRKTASPKEIVQAEKSIANLLKNNSVIPEHFPVTPQTNENYHRACNLDLQKQLDILEQIVYLNFEKLEIFSEKIKKLNLEISSSNYKKSDETIHEIIESYGYSHLLLRKSILIKSLSNNEKLKYSNELSEESGLSRNNNLVTSLIHCYKESQDFVGLKRSIMHTRNLGDWNRFSRDMLRLAFHPHAEDEEQLSQMIVSNLQSSLIDAVIITKINTRLLKNKKYTYLFKLHKILESSSLKINDIAEIYLEKEEPEDIFYQHSSAWIESDTIVKYRLLQDNFYDDPNSYYIKINDDLLSIINDWVAINDISLLNYSTNITKHSFSSLKKIENKGSVTKSAIFSYIIHTCEGKTYISEEDIIKLMGITAGLDRIINVEHIKSLAINLDSDFSKIILYLLIAKKSSNERDNHKLRSTLQRYIISNHESNLLNFIESVSEKSMAIARYTYDVCTEDFIATLSRIIKSSREITETRASLHQWMGEVTGDNTYLDRARNLIIDHQINLIRGEIDDNRIYVDTNRFTEWLTNEVSRDLSSILLIMEHNNELASIDEPQIISIIERCYFEFCTNKFFGIASYLGRRIRHGTFKGHLYSDVITIENNNTLLRMNTITKHKWDNWKIDYENKIDTIVREKLHIQTTQKSDGFLKPNIKDIRKQEVTIACIKNILLDFNKNHQVQNSIQLIVEYCWRIAEIDLKSINSYLKNQKPNITSLNELTEHRASTTYENKLQIKDFTRELHSRINDKFTIMYGWFKRPQSVSPKASLGLLFKAVVAEVQQTFKYFSPNIKFEEKDDIELMGGAYHLLYDAFYVIVYNAAKHGKSNGFFKYSFDVTQNKKRALECTIESENKNCESDDTVNQKLKVSSSDDIDNAQMHEERSGIRKLYHLERYDNNFSIIKISCENGKVITKFSYDLVH